MVRTPPDFITRVYDTHETHIIPLKEFQKWSIYSFDFAPGDKSIVQMLCTMLRINQSNPFNIQLVRRRFKIHLELQSNGKDGANILMGYIDCRRKCLMNAKGEKMGVSPLHQEYIELMAKTITDTFNTKT